MKARDTLGQQYNTNQLLEVIPAERRAVLFEHVTLHQGDLLHKAGHNLNFIYFLTSGWASLSIRFEDGFQALVSIVGREGMVGVAAAHRVAIEPTEAMVQVPSRALRMPIRAFEATLQSVPAFGDLILRYSNMRRIQSSQLAACSSHHGLENRLARTLLMIADTTDETHLMVTQETLATMLSVHRPTLTVTAGRLRRAGLIRQASGSVDILDRPGLESASCECYRAISSAARIAGIDAEKKSTRDVMNTTNIYNHRM